MDDTNKIEEYLRGNLSAEEARNLEHRLKTDTEFKRQFEFEKQLFETINEESWSFSDLNSKQINDYKKLLQEEDIQNLKVSLNKITQDSPKQKKTKTKLNYILYLAAASIIIFIVVFQFLKHQNTSQTELYYRYVNYQDLPSFVTRSSSVSSNVLVEAENHFEQQDYQASIDKFSSALNKENADARIYIYLGLANSELEKYKEAERILDRLINSDLVDSQKGYWYKALMYLKMGEVESAKNELNFIIKNQSFNYRKAQDLLEQLD